MSYVNLQISSQRDGSPPPQAPCQATRQPQSHRSLLAAARYLVPSMLRSCLTRTDCALTLPERCTHCDVVESSDSSFCRCGCTVCTGIPATTGDCRSDQACSFAMCWLLIINVCKGNSSDRISQRKYCIDPPGIYRTCNRGQVCCDVDYSSSEFHCDMVSFLSESEYFSWCHLHSSFPQI